jgi:hypothetical protein
MEELGFNVVRLGFMWSGYNPAAGVFNDTYLQINKDIIAKLNSHGVLVIVPRHRNPLQPNRLYQSDFINRPKSEPLANLPPCENSCMCALNSNTSRIRNSITPGRHRFFVFLAYS